MQVADEGHSIEEQEAFHLAIRLEAPQVRTASGGRIGISTPDLVAISRFADQVATAVGVTAAVQIMTALEYPDAKIVEALENVPSEGFFASQVSDLRTGSIEMLVTVAPALVVSWTLKNLVGEAVVEAWKESELHEKVRRGALRLFGGAAKAVEKSTGVTGLPANLRVEEVAAVTSGAGATPVGMEVIVRKTHSPELEALAKQAGLLADEAIETTDLRTMEITADEKESESADNPEETLPPPTAQA